MSTGDVIQSVLDPAGAHASSIHQLSRCSSMATRGTSIVRYAVVGLGHIAQVAMLPAFAHARRNSRLAALVSDDAAKLRPLSRKYASDGAYWYDEYDPCLEHVDAVYIAL